MTDTARKDPVRLLIVDDNQDAANSLARLLRILGFDTQTVYNGQQALEAARARLPDCVLSDIGLPGIDGYRLASLFRQDESLRNIPLVAITAYSEPEKAVAAGFDHHFVKPADPYALENTLRKILNMDARLERAEELVQKQGDVVTEAIQVMKEVKEDVKDIKEGLMEVKEDVKEIKKEVKGNP